MSLVPSVARSLRTRGAVWTARRLWSFAIDRIDEALFDVRFGTDTAGIVDLHELRIPSRNRGRGSRYQPTRPRPFARMMADLKLPKHNVFVDMGCGKGRVLLLAADYGFRKVRGVDFSPCLCAIARENISRYFPKATREPAIEVIEADVADYPVGDEESVFFLFHPFDAVVLNSLITNIIASMDRSPRPVWLIYENAYYGQIIARKGRFTAVRRYNFDGRETVVYRSKPGRQSPSSVRPSPSQDSEERF